MAGHAGRRLGHAGAIGGATVTKPRLTVASVVRNDLAGLRRTYEGLRAQTSNEFLWHVIDGGSNDGTREWLETLDCEGLRFLSENDNGHFHAMNKAIAALETEYVLFLNAGDVFYRDDVVAALLNEIERQPFELGYGAYVIGGLPGFPERVRGEPLSGRWKIFLGRVPCHQTMVIHRTAFERQGSYDTTLRLYADTDWILGYTQRVPMAELRYFDFPVVHYDPAGRSYSQFFGEAGEYAAMVVRRGNPIEILFGLAGWLRSAAYVAITRGLARIGIERI